MKSSIELSSFKLDVVIGSSEDNEIKPVKHILDLTLSI